MSTMTPRKAPRWHTARCGAELTVGLIALLCACTGLAARKRFDVRSVGAITVKGSDDVRLEDVGPKGRVLILNNGPHGLDEQDPELLLWDPATKAFVKKLTPDGGHAPMRIGIPRSLRIVDARGDLVGALGYYLAVIDGKRGILKKVLCAPDLKDSRSPYNDQIMPRSFVHGVVIARRGYTGMVAAAFNYGKWPRLFLLRPPWNAPYESWRMDRFVKALAWSPDGRTLAVLYSNAFNNRLKFVAPMHRGQPLPTLPDVALIDVRTGKTRLKFFTGDFESSIAFSPDRKFIYCVGSLPANPMHGWVVREFSASSGKLMRKFKKWNFRLKGNLAVSPGGRLLVADANYARFTMAVLLYDIYGYDRIFRFVVLDILTGNVVFVHKESTGPFLLTPPRFVFSPDGKSLYVDSHRVGDGSPQIKVYSIEKRR